MIKLFKTRKALKAEVADLKQQIAVQSSEMAKLRRANTDINRLWQDARKEKKELEAKADSLTESLRNQGIEHAAEMGRKNREIEALKQENAELKDTNNGLASSVSELKAKLKAAKKAAENVRSGKKTTERKPSPSSPYVSPETTVKK